MRFIIFILTLTLTPALAVPLYAQEVERLNAQLLPTIWYSSLEIKEGDNVRIYAGIQNNSGSDIAGSVTFYNGSDEIGKVSFSSPTDSLKEVSVPWKAVVGNHTFRAELASASPSGKTLLSSEAKDSLSVTKELTKENIKEGAEKVAESILEKINNTAQEVSDKILEYQITPDSEDGQTPSTKSQTNSKLNPNSNTEANSKVLGAVKKFGLDEKPAVVSVYNQLVHFAAGLVKYWQWTLGGIIILVLALRLTGGRKRRR